MVLKPCVVNQKSVSEAKIPKDIGSIDQSGKTFVTFGKSTHILNEGTKIELKFHSFNKEDIDKVSAEPHFHGLKHHKYIRQATKTLPDGTIQQIKFRPPNSYTPPPAQMNRQQYIGGEFFIASNNFDEKLSSGVKEWTRSDLSTELKELFTDGNEHQNNFTGHRDVYGSNKGATITEKIFNEKRETPNDFAMVRTSGAMTKDGQENLATDCAKGKDIFNQKEQLLYYDKNSKTLKKKDADGNLVNISPNGLAKFAGIMSDASRIQLLDCVTGQLDRHPGNQSLRHWLRISIFLRAIFAFFRRGMKSR